MEYYITFKNQGESQRTEILTEPENEKLEGSIKRNVVLLKLQGATSVRVHKV